MVLSIGKNAMLESPDMLHYFTAAKGSGQSALPARTMSFYDLDLPEA
jgi:hypothetical protein